MKIQNTPYLLILTLFILSCSQLGDSLRLPGEDPKDIIYYELNNDYLAPESRDFIEQNFPSLNVNTSYILIGKNTYGFEADLTNDKSLSFDEDGIFKFDREHPFLKDNYEKGKYGGGKREGKEWKSMPYFHRVRGRRVVPQHADDSVPRLICKLIKIN